MKKRFGLCLTAMILLGAVAQAEARPGGAFAPHAATMTTIPQGATVGPQSLSGGGALTNHGTIAGGSSPAVTSTGPGPVNITNYGTITSSTSGIATTGNSSSTIVNSGTISVQNTVVSNTGSATAIAGAGVSQHAP